MESYSSIAASKTGETKLVVVKTNMTLCRSFLVPDSKIPYFKPTVGTAIFHWLYFDYINYFVPVAANSSVSSDVQD